MKLNKNVLKGSLITLESEDGKASVPYDAVKFSKKWGMVTISLLYKGTVISEETVDSYDEITLSGLEGKIKFTLSLSE